MNEETFLEDNKIDVIFGTAIIDKICISCLKYGDVMSIFDLAYQNIPMWNIFYCCTSVLLKPNDTWKYMCNDCIQFLMSFQNFKIRSQNSYEQLFNTLDNTLSCSSNNRPQEKNKDLYIKELPETFDSMIEEEMLIVIEDDDENRESSIVESQEESPKNTERQPDKKTNNNDQVYVDNKTWTCKLCNTKFACLKEFKDHKYQERLKRTKKFSCTYCGKIFEKYKLLNHIFIHTGEKPFKCGICGKGISCKRYLRKHMMLHTGKSHLCSICGKGYTDEYSLNDHMNLHNRKESYVCPVCGKIYFTMMQFSSHRAQHKAKSRKVYRKPKARTVYTCEKCGKNMINKQNLEIHLAAHDRAKSLSCKICNKKFAHEKTLKKHLWMHQKRYRCKICFQVFSESELKCHNCKPCNKTVDEFRSNECIVCGQIFVKVERLKLHMRQHEKKTCDICGKSFNRARALWKHVNQHNLKCKICNKGFTKKSALDNHVKGEVCLHGKSRNRRIQF